MLFGKTKQLRTIAAPSTSMTHGRQSAIVLEEKTLGVIQYLAVVQLAVFLDFGEKLLSADLSAVEIVIPFQQVLDGGMHGPVARLLEVRDIQCVAVLFFF